MKAHTTLKLVIAMFVGVVLSACSYPGALTVTQPKTQGIPPGQIVSLSVETDVPNPLPVHQDAAKRVRERLFGSLVSERIFKAVVPPLDPADYSMDVKVRGAREVSLGARIMLGMMIGPNTTTVAVEARNRATNQVVTAFEATGTSGAQPLSSEAGLDAAVREVVDKIIDALR